MTVPDITYAACGCAAVLAHSSKCQRAHLQPLPHTEQGKQAHCDVEDGCVWLHTPSTLTPMTANRARHLGDELHACAQSLEKPR